MDVKLHAFPRATGGGGEKKRFLSPRSAMCDLQTILCLPGCDCFQTLNSKPTTKKNVSAEMNQSLFISLNCYQPKSSFFLFCVF